MDPETHPFYYYLALETGDGGCDDDETEVEGLKTPLPHLDLHGVSMVEQEGYRSEKYLLPPVKRSSKSRYLSL